MFRTLICALTLSIAAATAQAETCFGLDMKPGNKYELVVDEFGVVTPTSETTTVTNNNAILITVTKSYYEDPRLPGARGTFSSCTNAQVFVTASKQEVTEVMKSVSDNPIAKILQRLFNMMEDRVSAAID
ncbi:MAG TPA: hypothetical protein VJH21_00170 [Candidatus Paceibacterota bacterium]